MDMNRFETSDAQESQSPQPLYFRNPSAGVCVRLFPSIRSTPIQINITIPSDPTLASAVVTTSSVPPNAVTRTSDMDTLVTVRVEQFSRQSTPEAFPVSVETALEEEMENDEPYLISAPHSPSMETCARSPSPPKLVKEMLTFQRGIMEQDQEPPQLSKYSSSPLSPLAKQGKMPERGISFNNNDLWSCLKQNNINIEDDATARLSKAFQSMLNNLTAGMNFPSSLTLVSEEQILLAVSFFDQ
jgi:hypothetical protein